MIRVTWIAPTKHTSGRPIKADELTGFVLRMKVDGAPEFTDVAEPQADETEFELDVNDPGTYEFELVALGKVAAMNSAPAKGSIAISDDTPLEAPTITVELA